MTLFRLFETINRASATLKHTKAKFDRRNAELRAAGFAGAGDNPDIRTYAPTSEYPAPWHMSGSPEGIYDIYAANNKRVASWLSRREAEMVLREVGHEG